MKLEVQWRKMQKEVFTLNLKSKISKMIHFLNKIIMNKTGLILSRKV